MFHQSHDNLQTINMDPRFEYAYLKDNSTNLYNTISGLWRYSKPEDTKSFLEIVKKQRQINNKMVKIVTSLHHTAEQSALADRSHQFPSAGPSCQIPETDSTTQIADIEVHPMPVEDEPAN